MALKLRIVIILRFIILNGNIIINYFDSTKYNIHNDLNDISNKVQFNPLIKDIGQILQ